MPNLLGTAPNQVPTNADLGTMAFEDNSNYNKKATPNVIDVTSTGTALRITQTGAGNALVVEDSANPDSSPFVINNIGAVIQGNTTQLSTQIGGVSFTPANQIVGGTSDQSMAAIFAFGGSNPAHIIAKTQGTIASPTIVASGNVVGRYSFAGYDGTNFIEASRIQCDVDGTPGTNNMPGRLVFSTTADGASSPTERMRIDSAGRVGFSVTPNTATGMMRFGMPFTGAATINHVLDDAVIQSDVTATARYFRTTASTAASSFTLTALNHYVATQGTIGAGSSVTSQYGFHADSSLTGATNNYGFYSNIASGTGRWNFYAAGSATNYFAGRLRVGLDTNPTGLDIAAVFAGAGVANHNVAQIRYNSDGAGAVLYLAKSKGSGDVLVANGDTFGVLAFRGNDGAGFLTGASIEAEVDGTPSPNDMPGRLVFSTTADGDSSPTERWRINSSGTLTAATGSGLSISKTAVTAPAASDGNVFSGTYTPTLTNSTNVAASTAQVCQYMRVGSVVTVSGEVSIDPTATGAVVLDMSLPIASNLSAATQAAGTAIDNLAYQCCRIYGNGALDTLRFVYTATNAASASFSFTATYRII